MTQIDKLIGQAYEMVPNTDGWDDLIASLAHLIGGDSGVIYIKPSFLRGVGVLAAYGAVDGVLYGLGSAPGLRRYDRRTLSPSAGPLLVDLYSSP
jgi:hypothetical protein